MVALDSLGQELARVDFEAGVQVSERTLAVRGIRKVLIYQPTDDHQGNGQPTTETSSQRTSFAVDTICPPAGDPVLDSPDFQQAYDSLMRMSREDPMGGRPFPRESSTRGYYNPTTQKIEIGPEFFTQNDPCHVTTPAYDGPRQVATRIHTHPFTTGSYDVQICSRIPGDRYDPQANGGSRNESGDWDNSTGALGDYIVGPEWIFRLPPGTPVDQRPFNPNRWKKGANGCFTRQPLP
jgi:hypothetical protein